MPDKPLPPGYICYRCGEKGAAYIHVPCFCVITDRLEIGHYIQACPTNNDPEWDKRPRIKRTTGIPKAFLKPVEKPTATTNDGTLDDTKQPSGVMVTADGEWVVAEPDKASWDQYHAKAKVSAAAQEAAARGSRELQEKGLECSIDNRLFVDPTKTPCCQTTYCSECITHALLENDLTCPSCSTENILIDNLLPDEETASKIREYDKEKAPAQSSTEGSKSPKNLEKAEVKKESAYIGSPDLRKSPRQNGIITVTATVQAKDADSKGKKRPAEHELRNDRPAPSPSSETIARPSSNDENKSLVPGPKADTSSCAPQNPQTAYSNGNYMMAQGLNAMTFPNTNSYMSMPMQMSAGLFNPSMMDSTGFMNGAGGNWNTMWAPNYPQQPMTLPGPGFQNAMYTTAGYNQQHMQTLTSNSFNGTNGLSGSGHGRGHFPNQQRNHFHGQNANDEDSAYFRKPVNPHRHQGRRNLNRPTDYREI